MKLKAGDKAPKFTLPDQNGSEHSLSDYEGQWLLVYFYPRDNTPGCTNEAKAIRDEMAKFRRRKIAVFGVSTDSVKSHKKFADKHKLPFTLLSDEGKEMVKAYGVWGPKKFMGREFLGTKRRSFLIDPQGKIAKVYEKVKPKEHVCEVLDDQRELK